jgi:uncharacterized repeat protein (TIGR01451 family)
LKNHLENGSIMKKAVLTVLWLVLGALPGSGDEYVCQELPSQPAGQVGCSVNLHGDAAALGANLDGGGAVTYCHKGSDGTWSCDSPKVRANDGQPGDEFGRSVGLDGNWLAVGAPFANGSGAVYIFGRKDATSPWVQSQKIVASDAARGDQFGLTLALSGDTLIVGAPNNVGTTGSLSGAVYIFHWDGQSWKQGQKLTASDARAFDNFGFSLAIDGNVIVVGAPFHDGAGANSGEAYVFAWDGKTWLQTAQLTARDAAAGDEYGSAVAVSGDFLAVGARTDDVGGMQDAGSAYVYERSGSAWNEAVHLFGEAAGDRFGVAVSMSGTQLLTGALLHNGSGPESGAAYLFQRQPNGTWMRVNLDSSNVPQGGDRFGQAVSIDDQTQSLLVGAYLAHKGAGSAAVCSKASPHPFVDLALVKSGPASAEPGDTITYTLTVTNRGSGNATGVHLEDTIPAELQSVAPLPGGCMTAGQKVVCTRSDLSSGQKWVAHLSFTVLDVCDTIMNQATVSANEEKDPVPSNQVFTTVASTGSLTLTKTGPASAKPGETITYTLKVINNGSCPATGVHINDPIPAGLEIPRPPAPKADGCTFNPDHTAVVCNLPDLAPHSSTTVSLPPLIVSETCLTSIMNQATVSSNEGGPVPSNQVSTPVDRTAPLMISKTAPASVQPGDPITYTLTVTNLGPDIACGVAVSDPIPQGLTNPVLLPAAPPVVPPDGCTAMPNKIDCALAELPALTAQSFSVSFTVAAPCKSQIVNTAMVSAVSPAQQRNDSATTTVDCLSITKTDGLTTAFSGGTLTYTIVMNNPGQCPVTVSDPFPADLLMVLWCRDSAGGPPCVPFHKDPLQEALTDATATYRVRGMVSPMFTGTLSNTASVTGSCGSAAATDTTEVVFPPGVTVLCKGIDGTQVEGGTVIYTFVLRNGGPAAQMDNPGNEFSDLLPAGLTVVSTSASNGTVTLPPVNPVTWNGAIPVGGMVTITITAMVGAGTKGMTFCNAPAIAFDQDGDGTNESHAVAVPCCFTVPATIPTLTEPWLATLALLLALLALRRLRRRTL